MVSIGEDIVPSQHNPPLQDMGQALTDSLSRDGRGGMRANLPMGGFRVTNLAPGVQPTDAATVSQISTGGGVPVGSIMDFAGSAAPTGWLVCAGQVLSRSTYSDLFAAIGTAFGAPDASTFNLPDLRGRVSAGRDVDQGGFADRLTAVDSRSIGAAGGGQAVSLTEAQMPSHTHAVTGSTNEAGAHTHTYNGANVFSAQPGSEGVRGIGIGSTSSSGQHSHTISVSAAESGGGQSHPNVQPTIILTKIIKATS